MEEGTSEAQNYLYETLSPLSYSTTTTTAYQSPPSDDEAEPYCVFRNEISLSVLNPDSHQTAAPDFFSLDVGGAAEPIASTPAREPKTPACEAATPRLETAWFRGNCTFKSPMLKLHKGIFNFIRCFLCFIRFGFCLVSPKLVFFFFNGKILTFYF